MVNSTLIVFDCDGTLADSQHIIVESMRLTFESTGLVAPSRAEILRAVGLSLPEAFGVLTLGGNRDRVSELVSTYRTFCAALRSKPDAREPLFHGAAELLLSLAARNDVVLGMATGKSRAGVVRFIGDHGLDGVFSTIQTADDAPSKPHPAMLLQAMEETGLPPSATVMIGDTSYDMLMASGAKTGAIGVTWGHHSAADLKKAGAAMIAGSFAALERVLLSRLGALPVLEQVA
jgi:phosphoglycolate phosphatase